MPTASISLPDGTQIEINGSVEEVVKIVSLCRETMSIKEKKRHSPPADKEKAKPRHQDAAESNDSPDLSSIINTIHDCEESEIISKKILDDKSVLNRVLLPMYIVSKYYEGKWSLTSGEISKITEQLGVRVSVPNASTNLSGSAKGYLQSDKVRKKGATVRYKLNRRGLKYFEGVVNNSES